MRLWQKIILCILVIEIAGSLSGLLSMGSIKDWYATLTPPPGTPPNWVFGPVWTILYAMMGVAVARVWHAPPKPPYRRTALLYFFLQFLLNLAWTPVFFGAHQLGAALAIIVTLLIAIGFTIFLFLKVDKPAATLLIPYFIWVSYATYLNAGYLALN